MGISDLNKELWQWVDDSSLLFKHVKGMKIYCEYGSGTLIWDTFRAPHHFLGMGICDIH